MTFSFLFNIIDIIYNFYDIFLRLFSLIDKFNLVFRCLIIIHTTPHISNFSFNKLPVQKRPSYNTLFKKVSFKILCIYLSYF